jgi:membrane associated rhomboid family serine protease
MSLDPLDPLSPRPRREPMLNAPLVVVATILVLFAVHALRSVLGEAIDLGLVLDFGFVPARLTLAFDPERINTIMARAAESLPGLDPEQRMAFARYVLADGETKPWTLATHALLHGSWSHVLFNSLWLLAFGTPVARRLGSARFLLLCLVCAVAGAAAHTLAHPDDITPMIGASGAISGLMAAATRFVFRRNRPLAIIGAERSGADHAPAASLAEIARDRRILIFLAVWFGTNLLFGFAAAPLGLTEATIAWEAHMGGFVAGFLLFPLFDPVPRAPA